MPGIARQQWRARIETRLDAHGAYRVHSIARQQWRARIETQAPGAVLAAVAASPASNGGRGLKLVHQVALKVVGQLASPASNGGRGLKLAVSLRHLVQPLASPASNGGRGLKLAGARGEYPRKTHRPPAMAGAD